MTKKMIREAKTHFSTLIQRAVSGEEVIIARAGEPVAHLVPIEKQGTDRMPGIDRGKIIIKPDFNEPMAEFDS